MDKRIIKEALEEIKQVKLEREWLANFLIRHQFEIDDNEALFGMDRTIILDEKIHNMKLILDRYMGVE